MNCFFSFITATQEDSQGSWNAKDEYNLLKDKGPPFYTEYFPYDIYRPW